MTGLGVVFVGLLALFTGSCGTPTGPSATLLQLSLASTNVVAGASSEGTLTLSGAAPSGGVPVTISSSDGAAAVPASLTVSAGSSTATFTIQTRVVAADTNATITVAVGGQTRAVMLHIIAPVPMSGTHSCELMTEHSSSPILRQRERRPDYRHASRAPFWPPCNEELAERRYG